MGAINNAFTQAAGAVAGSAVAIKHTKEVELSKLQSADNAALIARNQAREAEVAANDAKWKVDSPGGLMEQSDEADKKLNKAAINALNAENVNMIHPSPTNKRKAEKRAKELEEAQKAMNFLSDSIIAETHVMARAVEQRAHARKLTEIAYREKKRYKSRWGGIE